VQVKKALERFKFTIKILFLPKFMDVFATRVTFTIENGAEFKTPNTFIVKSLPTMIPPSVDVVAIGMSKLILSWI
jgi:hypothetical protein